MNHQAYISGDEEKAREKARTPRQKAKSQQKARTAMTFPRQIDPNVTALTCSDHISRSIRNRSMGF